MSFHQIKYFAVFSLFVGQNKKYVSHFSGFMFEKPESQWTTKSNIKLLTREILHASDQHTITTQNRFKGLCLPNSTMFCRTSWTEVRSCSQSRAVRENTNRTCKLYCLLFPFLFFSLGFWFAVFLKSLKCLISIRPESLLSFGSTIGKTVWEKL